MPESTLWERARVDFIEYYPYQEMLRGFNIDYDDSGHGNDSYEIDFERKVPREKLSEYLNESIVEELFSNPVKPLTSCNKEGLYLADEINVGKYLILKDGEKTDIDAFVGEYGEREAADYIKNQLNNNSKYEIKEELATVYFADPEYEDEIVYYLDSEGESPFFEKSKEFTSKEQAQKYVDIEREKHFNSNKENYGYSLGAGFGIDKKIIITESIQQIGHIFQDKKSDRLFSLICNENELKGCIKNPDDIEIKKEFNLTDSIGKFGITGFVTALILKAFEMAEDMYGRIIHPDLKVPFDEVSIEAFDFYKDWQETQKTIISEKLLNSEDQLKFGMHAGKYSKDDNYNLGEKFYKNILIARSFELKGFLDGQPLVLVHDGYLTPTGQKLNDYHEEYKIDNAITFTQEHKKIISGEISLKIDEENKELINVTETPSDKQELDLQTEKEHSIVLKEESYLTNDEVKESVTDTIKVTENFGGQKDSTQIKENSIKETTKKFLSDIIVKTQSLVAVQTTSKSHKH